MSDNLEVGPHTIYTHTHTHIRVGKKKRGDGPRLGDLAGSTNNVTLVHCLYVISTLSNQLSRQKEI